MTPTPTTDPDYEPLDHDEYLDRYEAWKQDIDWPEGPWYDKALNRKPRGFVDRRGDGPPVIVVDISRFTGWREHVYRGLRTLGIHLGLIGLVTHEWGHAQGLSHPEDLGRFVDVMGAPSLRIRDRHDLLGESYEWRREHDLLDKT